MRVLVALILILSVYVQASAQQTPYHLRPGDKIEVWVEQDPNLRRQVLVEPDGRISLPLAGHLRAAGLTPEGLEAALTQRLQKHFTSKPDISVMLLTTALPEGAAVRESTIYVTGEVNKPGAHVVQTPTNVLQAIALAGGLGPYAAKGRIQIRRTGRGGAILIPFNYHDVEDGNELPGNIILRSGDVVVVPERGLLE